MAKRRYSKELRFIGYCIIVLEVLTVFTWGAAFYSNVGVMAATAVNALGSGNGHGPSLTNTSAGASLSVPITGAGFFPVTVTATALFMNGQNQTVSQAQGSVTVSPGETKNITVLIPSSIGESRSAINAYSIRITFDASCFYSLVGIRGQVVVQPGKLGGNST